MSDGYLSIEESNLAQTFLRDGYVIQPAENQEGLDRLRQSLVKSICEHLRLNPPSDETDFLDNIHHHISSENLNEVRLKVFNDLNKFPSVRRTYYSLARETLNVLVGNELAMQKRINLSIQLPDDDSSLLPVHADVWSGDSPFEVVIWVPLVNCYGTKTMFLLPPKPDQEVSRKLALFREKSAEDLYKSIETDLHWINISYGEVLVFTQNLMHGNRINTESQTRWSLNCRFKSLFSPYAEKRLGDFFEPITIRPATRFGMNYRLPEGFG